MQRRGHDVARLADGDRLPALVEHFDEDRVVADVVAVAGGAFPREQVELVSAVDVDDARVPRVGDRAPRARGQYLAAADHEPRPRQGRPAARRFARERGERRRIAGDDVGAVPRERVEHLGRVREPVEVDVRMHAQHPPQATGPRGSRASGGQLPEADDAIGPPDPRVGERAQPEELEQVLFERRAGDREGLAGRAAGLVADERGGIDALREHVARRPSAEVLLADRRQPPQRLGRVDRRGAGFAPVVAIDRNVRLAVRDDRLELSHLERAHRVPAAAGRTPVPQQGAQVFRRGHARAQGTRSPRRPGGVARACRRMVVDGHWFA